MENYGILLSELRDSCKWSVFVFLRWEIEEIWIKRWFWVDARVVLNPNFSNGLLPLQECWKVEWLPKVSTLQYLQYINPKTILSLVKKWIVRQYFFRNIKISLIHLEYFWVSNFALILAKIQYKSSHTKQLMAIHPSWHPSAPIGWGTKLYSQVSHSHHSHRCGGVQTLGAWIHYSKFSRVAWALLLL